MKRQFWKKIGASAMLLRLPLCIHFLAGCLYTASSSPSTPSPSPAINVSETPEKCDIFAEEGDILSITFTESYGGTRMAGLPTVITLGDTGLISGWNEGLLGACVNERRKLVIPASSVFKELPPYLGSNVNITYEITVVAIDRPEPDMEMLQELQAEYFMATMVITTEDTKDISFHQDTEDVVGPQDAGSKDKPNRKGTKGRAEPVDSTAQLIFYAQLMAIPVVVLLALLLVYHIYRIKHPHKRTTFLKVSDLDPE